MYKFLLLLTFGVTLSAEIVAGVSIIVKDKAITLYDIEQKRKLYNASAEEAAQALIREKLEEIEVVERKISVNSSEVYDDIKETAKRNGMSVNDFYEAALNTKGINSAELKEQVKQKLLSQKLYASIAYSKLSTPSDKELEEYFQLHKSDFSQPSSFTVTIYQTTNKESLANKIANPMFHAPQIQQVEQVLPYNRISPELAKLLQGTEAYTFTPIIPDGKGGHMSFFLKEIDKPQEIAFENVKNQVQGMMLAQKREQVLSDYFTRLKDNTDIQILREPS